MRNFYSLIFAAFIFYFSACQKETVAPIDFSNMTYTDSTCTLYGAKDSTDWGKDSTWATYETSLMTFSTDTLPLQDTLIGNIEVSPACPNPSRGIFLVGVYPTQACKMKIVCVNTSYQVLYYSCKFFTGGPIMNAFDFSNTSAFHKNENYRMYYAFYNAHDSLYYKGHGDFRIE